LKYELPANPHGCSHDPGLSRRGSRVQVRPLARSKPLQSQGCNGFFMSSLFNKSPPTCAAAGFESNALQAL
jgi:hypothetical protein